MRIISGSAKGRKLLPPQGLATRPTGDRVKEDLFNIIGPSIRLARFLDLFAGSGAIGLEALSRGAESVVFVDEAKDAADLIRRNMERTGLTGKLLKMPVSKAVLALGQEGKTFDYIFMDPPYLHPQNATTLSKVLASGLLEESGLLIMEHGLEENLSWPGFLCCKEKIYRSTKLVFLQREKSADTTSSV